ncbi:uncharacterized protein CIMG_10468 [Coccidioides immitis RS]|uniref:Uncharacterized protein n=1 Tax=Coccidioides immitis (strain RS) TaxID=246410 RepID=A0A0D8JSW5_COCIM|nr:uncharacterized protein CIMG_10468 [Coccidioides immitis RS]KJF60377.1 hypothetical protein CIMG_10468 [Coccidioides immitis RS]
MADHEEFKKIHWQLRKVLRFGSQRSIIIIIICRSTDNPYLGSRFHYPTENAALCTQKYSQSVPSHAVCGRAVVTMAKEPPDSSLKSVFQEYRRPFGLSLKGFESSRPGIHGEQSRRNASKAEKEKVQKSRNT